MNLPNKLTVLRMLLVPVFMAFLLLDQIPHHFLWAMILFALASITDALDGYIARRDGLVTTFGKFLDPLADKLLVMSALICFVALDLASPVAVIIILAREFMVTSLRTIAAADGSIIAASPIGKIKAAVQMVVIVGILLGGALGGFTTSTFDLAFWAGLSIWITAILTIFSGIDYLAKNASVFRQMK